MDWFQDERSIEEISLFDLPKAYDGQKLKLPFYQRDAVWSEGRICALWDSLLRGFPLPSFLLVKGKGNSREFPYDSSRGKSVTKEDGYYDVLDGQQRFSAILAGLSNTPDIRLWIDLCPPTDKEHPLKFAYWLHPCTRIFPFGVRMEKSGDYDFCALHDRDLLEIWKLGKEPYQWELEDTYPWEANCPVPLVDLMQALEKNQSADHDNLKGELNRLIEEQRDKLKKLKKTEIPEQDEPTMDKATKALLRLKKTKLAIQLINLENLDEEDKYALFERIGRGGVQISARQLAASKLMSMLGKTGNLGAHPLRTEQVPNQIR